MRATMIGWSGALLVGICSCSSSSESESTKSVAPATAGADADGAELGEPGVTDGDPDEIPATDGVGSSSDETNESEGAPDPVGLVGGNDEDGDGNGGGGPPMVDGDEADGDEVAPPVAAAACPPGPFPSAPLTDASTPEPVCTGMGFTEGAVWFADRGTLYFSDIIFGATTNVGVIYSYVPGGACEEFIDGAGTNGLAIAPDGNLLGCRHGDQTLTIFDLETKEPRVLVAGVEGAAFNSPNDVAVRSDGNMYFTDPTYLRGPRPEEVPPRAYRRDPSGALTVIDEGVNTNGISLSPDEARLYVSRLGGGQNNSIVVFDLDESGAVGAPSPFANVGSDGMGVDCAGNLYVTQGGVRIFAPNGDPIGTINTPGAANVAFGGPERRTLYVTATDTLYAVEMAIPGLPY